MAIEKTTFTGTTVAVNLTEIKDWLSSCATEYFDDFEIGTLDGVPINVVCRISNAEVLKLENKSESINVTVSLPNGTTAENYGGKTAPVFKYAKKTNSGIYLYSTTIHIFITKSDKNTTAVLLSCYTTASAQKSFIADFGYSSKFVEVSHTASVVQNDLTSFSNVVCNGGTMLPNLFRTPDSEYAGIDCNFDYDGIKYVYDGYFALRE